VGFLSLKYRNTELTGLNRMVYGAAILEREKFLRSLYEQLDDRSKSKILLNKKLVKVEHRDNGISVQCADGTEFEGDFVVGADGIHSRVRLEMQRIAGNIGPPGFLDRDKHCMSVSLSIPGMTLNNGVDLPDWLRR
jgi:2-polyprenyl-6-methoxyphenol hydroxylase-like FAD-dependent oxidoreductase